MIRRHVLFPLSMLLAASAFMPAWSAQLLKAVPAAKAATTPDFIVGATSVAVDTEALREAGVGGTIDVSLPDGTVARIMIEALETHANGDITWRGRVEDATRDDLLALGTTGAAGTYGEIQTANGSWGLIPSRAGHDWLFDKSLAEAMMPRPVVRDDAPVPPGLVPQGGLKATCPTVASLPSPVVTIDVLAVLAPDFVSTHGGRAGAETRLNNLFASINAYLQASNVAIQYRRVETLTANYQAASTANDDDLTALNAITAGSGSFANVAALRNYYGADMVGLFRGPKSASGNSISGIAWLSGDGAGNLGGTADSHMYSVMGDWTFPTATLPAHELGHNLGNAHDRPNAGGGGGLTSYSFGHYVCGTGAVGCGSSGSPDMGTGFGTIMAYELPTVAKFANPNLTCKSTRAGSLSAPCGVDGQQDDVRSMNCVRQSVAALRNSWLGTCNLATDTDRDGIPDCIEAAVGRSSGAKDNDIFSSNLLFVAQQYRDFLGREPDADGFNYWLGAIAGGAQTRTTLVDTFFNSTEFQQSIAPVARLYFAFFLRFPDYSGLQYWIGRYKAGMTLQEMAEAFAQSAEFQQRYGSLSNAQFVTLVYNNVLGRAPDSSGQTFYLNQLNTGAMDRGAVMTSFSESAEYVGLSQHEVYVTMIYVGMLRREPDVAGFQYWLGQIDGGTPGQALIQGFVGGPEYHNRFLP
jgi:hypothetical protein